MGRPPMWVNRVSGRESRDLQTQLAAVTLRTRELERERDEARESLARREAAEESPSEADPTVHQWMARARRWVPSAVIVVTLVVLLILGGRAFGVFADDVDAAPAPDLGSFSVRVETAPGAAHPPLLVSRDTHWRGANSFQVQFDVNGPSWSPWRTVEASRVIVAAPVEMLNWVCAPMVTATADDGNSAFLSTEWSRGAILADGAAMTAAMGARLNPPSAPDEGSLTNVLAWDGADMHRTVSPSEYVQSSSGTQRLVGVECIETKPGATLEVGLSNTDWMEWSREHLARIAPPLEEGSLRRWRIPGVNATTTDSYASRFETSFDFPVSWSLLSGEIGDLSVSATAISSCAQETSCRDKYSGSAYSWVFQDTIALQAEQQRTNGASLVFSVLAGFVLSEAAARLRKDEKNRRMS